MTFEEFINQSKAEIKTHLCHFCACKPWADHVIAGLPVTTKTEFEALMLRHWSNANEQELLEAFSAHPRIGDIKVLKDKFATQAHTEQGQVKQADHSILESLMLKNDLYFEKFGFIFIICAKGQPAEAMLDQLELRLDNNREIELKNAALEQQKIMLLRFYEVVN